MVREKFLIEVRVKAVLEVDGVDTMEQTLASNVWEHGFAKGTTKTSVLSFLKVLITAMEQKFSFLKEIT